MNYFLAKTDPDTYSIHSLEKDKTTTWDGVRNAQAVNAIKSMKRGDRVLIYHSQGESAVRGLAEVANDPQPDPKDTKSWIVDFKFLKKFNEPFITLGAIKETKKFEDFSLVKQSRLSTMAVPGNFVTWLKAQGLKI